MNILLHVCCAPCSIFPVEELKAKAHRVAGYFYNPNIHPYSEYLKRRAEAEKFFKESGLNLISAEYDAQRYFQYVVHNEARADRCPPCWWMRIDKTARFARENGFEAFTTTLLGSPYQDHEILKSISRDVAEKAGLKFYYGDFRPGFRGSIETARAKGMYVQNYCGCLFSEMETLVKRERTEGVREKGSDR